MNILNNGYFSRYSRVALACCKEKPTSVVCVGNNDHKHVPCRIKLQHPGYQAICAGNLRITTGLAMWTQVRFQKDCPRLHRDINFPNFDSYRKDEYLDVRRTSWGMGDGKAGPTYVVGFFGLLCGAYYVKANATQLVCYMAAALDVLALAKVEIDISKVIPGGCLSYKWRGKPVFIKNRTPAEISAEADTPLSELRDPESPEARTQKPEWLVVIGICTHLGCVPIPNTGEWVGGFYCPCHGSHYDNIGRARKGPAPLNLVVPPYRFVSDTVIEVG